MLTLAQLRERYLRDRRLRASLAVTETLWCRVTPNEAQCIRTVARELGITVSDVIRYYLVQPIAHDLANEGSQSKDTAGVGGP
jgi:hypothetical protein